MATNSVQYIFEIIDKYTPALRKIVESTKKLNKNIKKSNKKFVLMRKRVKEVGQSMNRMGKSLSLKVTAPLMLLIGASIKSAAKLERLRVLFIGLTGSVEKAAIVVDQLNEFTATTPFRLEQVSNAAKKLLAAGVEETQLLDSLRLIGDISAASGKPIGDLGRIYARIKSVGRAGMEELRMFLEAGIPVTQAIADIVGTSVAGVDKISREGRISFELVRKALEKMTAEGGFAYKATILQAKTLEGLWSTVRDNLLFLGASIGDVLLPKLKKLAVKTIDIAQKIIEWAKAHPGLIKLGLIIGGILAVLGPMVIVLGKIAFALYFLYPLLIKVGLGWVLGFWPLILIIGAIAALSVGLFYLIKNWEKVKKTFSEYKVLIFIKALIFAIGERIEAVIDFTKTLIEQWEDLSKTKFFEMFTKIIKFTTVKGIFDISGEIGKSAIEALTAKVETAPQIVKLDGGISVDVSTAKGVNAKVATEGAVFNRGRNMKGR